MKSDICLSLLMDTFDGKTAEVIAVRFGETGYFPTTYGRKSTEWVEMMNTRLGLSSAEVQAMESCSMNGAWVNYDNILKHLKEAMGKLDTDRGNMVAGDLLVDPAGAFCSFHPQAPARREIIGTELRMCDSCLEDLALEAWKHIVLDYVEQQYRLEMEQ